MKIKCGILTAVLLLTLAGCGSGAEKAAVDKVWFMNADVVEVSEHTVLVKERTGDESVISTDVQWGNPLPELKPGDAIRVIYDGDVAETYPAQMSGVYAIFRLEDLTKRSETVPMVMVEGTLYRDTGVVCGLDGKCGMMDGYIVESTASTKRPDQDDMSNFGVGFGYQRGADGNTIEVCVNGNWWVFAAEEADG